MVVIGYEMIWHWTTTWIWAFTYHHNYGWINEHPFCFSPQDIDIQTRSLFAVRHKEHLRAIGYIFGSVSIFLLPTQLEGWIHIQTISWPKQHWFYFQSGIENNIKGIPLLTTLLTWLRAQPPTDSLLTFKSPILGSLDFSPIFRSNEVIPFNLACSVGQILNCNVMQCLLLLMHLDATVEIALMGFSLGSFLYLA